MNLFERIGQIVVIGSLLSSVYMIFTMAEASSEGESEIFGGRFRVQARRTTYGNDDTGNEG